MIGCKGKKLGVRFWSDPCLDGGGGAGDGAEIRDVHKLPEHLRLVLDTERAVNVADPSPIREEMSP